MFINANLPNARLFVKDSCDLKDHLNLVSYQQSLAAKFLHFSKYPFGSASKTLLYNLDETLIKDFPQLRNICDLYAAKISI